MRPTILSQEILLLTATSFSNKQLSGKDPKTGDPSLSTSESLEQACWDGLLYEMLPGIVNASDNLFIWQIRNEGSYLKVSRGVCLPEIKSRFSLDPHQFLCDKEMN